MRTTIRLDPHLLTEAKKIAADSGRTLTAVIEDALRESFARRARSAELPEWTFPTFGGDGLLPGVDLNNSAALWDLIESERDDQIRQRIVRKPKRRG